MATPDRGLRDKAINIINNVGQYGPLDATIDSYKQAADYADDARQYAELALSGVEDLQTQITRVSELSEEVEDLNDKVQETYTQVTTLDVDATDGSTASAVYDKTENKIHFTLPSGKDGVDGENGKSAYQSYLDTTTDNPKLSEADWILSLHGKDGIDGEDGKDGKDGINGTNGTNGTNGYSAYELAVLGGYDGTLEDFNNLNTKSLDRNQNLSELTNVVAARTNLDVYSTSQVDSAISTSSSDLQTLINAKANKGVNSDITALSGLTVALSVGQGGTGAKTAADARTNLGAAKIGVNSDITDLTALTGPLDVKKDGLSGTKAITYQQFTRASLLEQLMVKMAGGEAVKFAAFGDSTTDGNYTSNWTANPVDSNGNAVGQIDHNTTAPNAWPMILQGLLREMHNNNSISVWNAGYGGRKLIDDWAINNYDTAITNNPSYGKPDATFIDFGLNDFVSATAGGMPDYNTYFSKHRTLIEFIIAKGTLPILLTSGPTSQNGGDGTNLRDNAQIMRICNEGKFKLAEEYNIPIIDKSTALRDWAEKTNNFTWYGVESDFLHFGDVGHSVQASFIATQLFNDVIYAGPGCREAVNFLDSRTNSASGGGWFADSNTKFGGNRTYSASSYTASKVLMKMYVWCTGKDVAAIYRGIDNDGSSVSNSAKISVYQYANKTDIYAKDIPNSGFPESSTIRYSNQAHTLNRLDYGLYRITYIAPPTPVAIYVGHFEFIDGWVPGRNPTWFKNAGRSWRSTNLLKNSGDLVFYGGALGSNNVFGVPAEDPDGSNVFYWRSTGFQSSSIILSAGMSQNNGIMLLSNRGWIPSSPNVASYDAGLLLFRRTDNSLGLYSVIRNGSTVTATALATGAASKVTTDAAQNYIVEFIRTAGTGYYIKVSFVTDSFVIGEELLRYTVAEGDPQLIPSSGVFGGHYVGTGSGNHTGSRIIRATAMYFN